MSDMTRTGELANQPPMLDQPLSAFESQAGRRREMQPGTVRSRHAHLT